jgi:threonine/homoserine/homoserine lactone efflux protein
MLALVTIFFSSFVIALSGAMMPGPLLTATISESTRHGAKAGPLLILGHGILELLLVAALLFGLAPLLKRDSVFVVIAGAGSIVLLWMAITMFRSLPRLRVEWEAAPSGQYHLVINGMLLSLANPYWTIWWASIGLGYIFYCRQFGSPGVFFFFLGHIAADLSWYAMVSLVVGRGRRFFSDRLYRAVIGICAVFLVIFAGYFAWAGMRRLLG